MALTARSLFLYGFQVTDSNKYINFKVTNGGQEYTATLRLGFYSLTSLGNEIERAMLAANNTVTYTVSVDRTLSGGLQNRVTISTSSDHFEILFATGTQAAASPYSLIGFGQTDYSGATTYTGSSSAGTALVTTYEGHSYVGPEFDEKVQGTVNVSSSGLKESIVFQVTEFFSVEFRYEPRQKAIDEWKPLLRWLIQQRAFEFTPEISSPSTFYEATLESTSSDSKGLAYKMVEMLPNLPNKYSTGLMRFRRVA